MEKVRSFIAIDLSKDIHDRLSQVLDRLRNEIHQNWVRWVKVENIHLTLKFLGDVPASNIQTIRKLLAAVLIAHPKFTLQVGHLGAFPDSRNPRVIWVGVEAPPLLSEIVGELESRLMDLGYPQEKRTFSPHLTLGRVSKNTRRNEIKKIGRVIQFSQIGAIGSEQVEAVHLYKSDLRSSGAVYSKIATCHLM
jgi:2'-5' RNA ligase